MLQTKKTKITEIVKRNGDKVSFDRNKIFVAVSKAMKASSEFKEDKADVVTKFVERKLLSIKKKDKKFIPTVELVQDFVEESLMSLGFKKTAKAYILYRAKRAERRLGKSSVSEHIKKISAESKKYFKDNSLGEFVYLRTYARWIEKEQRRETWIETVDRFVSFMKENLGDKVSENEYLEVKQAILNQEVMPSMRLMQFAGEPARRCNTCAYNCAFVAPSKLKDFSEIMYLSMQGCGVGFSVESQNVEKLPQIKKQIGKKLATFKIEDCKEGWCDALNLALSSWYRGADIDFDFSLIRPAGSKLKVMGGKASGPEPLRDLLYFAKEKILKRQGRRLRPVDVYDIICKIGECVVSGGVRRTAMISLSDFDDVLMRDAKKGQFFLNHPHRNVSNNSAVYENVPTSSELLDEWLSLVNSGTGERGIFNKGSLSFMLPERRKKYFKKVGVMNKDGVVIGSVGTNPCGEVILQSKQFCNLTEIIARPKDSREDLLRKARLATLLGTYQSTLTNFKYISSDWTKHCQEERLLGVSITGQWDCHIVRNAEVMTDIKNMVLKTNKVYAKRFGVNESMSVTAVKPSGTISQTFNCSSGIHPRHSKYYLRRIRISATDNLFKMLKDQGVPYYPEVGQDSLNANTFVLEFPVKAPEDSKFRDDFTALEQLEYWKMVKVNYTEHNPSATISVAENEWIDVLNWVSKNWNIISGLTFLPRFDYVYKLAPYEAISKERYEKLSAEFPVIDYSKLIMYEKSDETERKQELACAGGLCEVDVVLPTAKKV